MGDNAPEAPRHPSVNGGSSELSSIERVYIKDFAGRWRSLADGDREVFVPLYIWTRTHKREHEEEAAKEAADAVIAKDAADKAEKAKDQKANRRVTIAIAVATILSSLGSYIGTHANSTTTPQKIVVQFPNGQQVVVTPIPSPTSSVIEP